jgi:hypothetical protein
MVWRKVLDQNTRFLAEISQNNKDSTKREEGKKPHKAGPPHLLLNISKANIVQGISFIYILNMTILI